MAETHRKLSLGKLVLNFLWCLLVARVIVGISRGNLGEIESWVSLTSWVGPLGFALIGTYAFWNYWYRSS